MIVEMREGLERLGVAAPIRNLLASMKPEPEAFAVGGFPRDILRSQLSGEAAHPKDVDIVIDTDELAHAMGQVAGRVARTPFGGYRWSPTGASTTIDVWQLADTVWIREHRLPATIEMFLAGVDLNIDRIAVGLHDGSVIDGGCREAISSERIRLDATIRIDSLRCDEIARAFMASYKTGFPIENAPALPKPLSAFIDRGWERLREDGYSDHDIALALRVAAA